MGKKAVIQLSLDAEVIKEWPSVTAAGKGLGKTLGSISSCLTGNLESAFGFQWVYKDVKSEKRVKPKDVTLTREQLKKKYELIPYNKKYIKLGLSDPKKWVEFLKWCEAQAEEEAELRGERITASKNGINKVVQYTMEGERVAEYFSARAAQTETGIKNIGVACRGLVKHAGGYIWKYEENTNPQPQLGKKYAEKIGKPKKVKTKEELDEEDYYNDVMKEY